MKTQIRLLIKEQFGSGYSKLTTLLVNKTLKFPNYYTQRQFYFCGKTVRKFLTFFSKNWEHPNFMRTIEVNESLTNDFVKLTML